MNTRKYGVALTITEALRFEVYSQDGLKYAAPTFAVGDVQISKDGGAFANTTNLPVAVGSSFYLILTAAELTAANVYILISDQTATQTWLDTSLSVVTHGDASAMYVFDFDVVMRGTNGANTTVPDNTGITTIINNTKVPKQNIAFSDIPVLMVDSIDHVSPKTGLTLTVTRSIDGGGFGAATGAAAEVGNGIYQFDASAADMNGTVITFRFSGTAADDTFITIHTKP